MERQFGSTEIMDALRRHFGETVPASRVEGPREMAEALQTELGIRAGEARRLVDGLIDARSIRWVEGGETAAGAAPGALSGVGGVTSPFPAGVVASSSGANEGYWLLT